MIVRGGPKDCVPDMDLVILDCQTAIFFVVVLYGHVQKYVKTFVMTPVWVRLSHWEYWTSHDVNPRDKWGRVQYIRLGHPVQFSRYFVPISCCFHG